jgi:hypothetical protein
MKRLVKEGSILMKISHAGLRKRNYLKTRWIPGQARNDAKT